LPNKKFTSLQHFFEVFDAKKLNKKVIEALAKAGAFDELGEARSTVMKNYPALIEWSNQLRDNKSIGQASLFEVGDSTDQDFSLDVQKPWTRSDQLMFEKEVLGFYLSDHPLKGYENLMSLWSTSEIATLPKVDLSTLPKVEATHRRQRDAGKPRVTLAGLVVGAREVITKKGPRMAFARLEDLSGSIEIVIFPDTYSKHEELLKQDRPLLLAGLLETEDGQFKVIVDSMIALEEALSQLKMVSMDLTKFSGPELETLAEILKRHPGSTKVEFTVVISELERAAVLTSRELVGLKMGDG
jgi:DNA polymerase-3 subunit alpha